MPAGQRIAGDSAAEADDMSNPPHHEVNENDIAIIGLTGRFPGASHPDDFWRNLRDGVESVSFFTQRELDESAIPAFLYQAPRYVAARAVLNDVESFDAPFFGVNPRDAAFMDPQHRVFLECAWEALESAGYDPDRYEGAIGVYAGASTNSYLIAMLSHAELVAAINDFQTIVGNDKDFLATRASYHLNLRGPSVNVQTACSTSLVAVHLACQSLLTGECDMALAGGVSIRIPQRSGYVYQDGGILSADGHCRAFDAAATGTVGGNGAGVVLLKRLSRALNDGDHIRAVIRGSAVNNDGSNKVGFTAPSVMGQAAVIAEAIGVAGLKPDDISYVEAHGTGTALGDPIEIAALAEVFGPGSHRQSPCPLGSVKANIGHLDAAAGIAGLIKTVLTLEHRQLPPSVNFTSPNPKIPFEGSAVRVNRQLEAWETNGAPRCAGVSSFGIGGTNAHLVVQEAPAVAARPRNQVPQLLVLSARTESALEESERRLLDHLRQHPDLDLSDAAFTLQMGRRPFRHRSTLVCHNRDDAVRALERREVVRGLVYDGRPRSIAFLFPGQGSQWVNMGRELYEWEPGFRDDVDRCAGMFEPLLGEDLRAVLYPDAGSLAEADERLKETRCAQPALFVVEYGIARLWERWGIRPDVMIGHSLGEYAAACFSGVLSLPDAVRLVAARGRLMQQLPVGGMMSVDLGPADVMPLLTGPLSLAAVNAPSMCVVAGPVGALDTLETELRRQRRDTRRLHVTRAFHSPAIDSILDAFGQELASVRFNRPAVPYVSNLSGTWITPEQVSRPQYWLDQLRRPVRFADGLRTISEKGELILIEVGAGRTLTTLARLQLNRASMPVVTTSLGQAGARRSAIETMLEAAGQLWATGVEINWPGICRHSLARRVPLPTYPFDRRRCWIERKSPQADLAAASGGQDPVAAESHPRPGVAAAYVDPETETERRIAAIWKELLGIERVGVHDDFFDLGGHSLLLTRLITRLRETFDVDLPLERAFQCSTIATLADVVAEYLLAEVETMAEEDVRRLLGWKVGTE
jgi:acyl transferase domain-containing protein